MSIGDPLAVTGGCVARVGVTLAGTRAKQKPIDVSQGVRGLNMRIFAQKWEDSMQANAKTPVAMRKLQLERRLAELGARLEAIDEELDSHHNPDWSELAVEREVDEVLEATGGAGLLEIRQIRAALGRIENGTYGDCVNCGAAIAQARLDAIPWTPLCRECAR
jgi:RNA polymerase-binding transcription factor DksA